MKRICVQILAGCALWLLSNSSATAAEPRLLHSHLHAIVAGLTPVGTPAADQRLNLVIGLPLHNQRHFQLLLRQLYDPASPNYRRFLTHDQLMAKFGPAETDYQAVLNFAKTNGLQVEKTYDNRLLLDVSGTVSQIEKTFHFRLRLYQHPHEPRKFFAPDAEATVDASLPILDVSGWDNYTGRHPMAHRMPDDFAGGAGGSATNGLYGGYDFRNAYASNVNATGSGQSVGVVEFEGYYGSDITNYENSTGLPHVPLVNVFLDGLKPSNFINTNDPDGMLECSIDIELPIAMAPGMDALYVFEATNSDHLLDSMIANTQIKQFSCSWGLSDDATSEQDFQIMQAQGQSFFAGCGDGDAYIDETVGYFPGADTNITLCGGTQLTMEGSGQSYISESVWNDGSHGYTNGWCCNPNPTANTYWGSGGGFSSAYTIPPWQLAINMVAVGGSSTYRDIPDVALTATGIWGVWDKTSGGVEGTSCAGPLWAGFTALVNENAANQGLPSIGFLNPPLYALAQTSAYQSVFNDVTNGNNTWSNSPSHYYAAPGYDLCTGLGTPNGQAMIDALLNYSGPIWVNFAGACPGNGTYTNAFCTLSAGVSAVADNGTICLVGPNSSPTTITISKPMRLQAFYGPVVIGK